jgi:DNA-binding MarR family transcriptional regulator
MAPSARPPTLPPEFGVYFELIQVSALVEHSVARQLREEGGLSVTQFQILATLGEDPSAQSTMTALADRLVHSRSGLTYQVARLEEEGLVVRGPSVDDERSVNVTLTAEGSALLGRVLPGHLEVVREVVVDVLEPSDREELTRLLGLVRASMRARPPRSARRGRSARGKA